MGKCGPSHLEVWFTEGFCGGISSPKEWFSHWKSMSGRIDIISSAISDFALWILVNQVVKSLDIPVAFMVPSLKRLTRIAFKSRKFKKIVYQWGPDFPLFDCIWEVRSENDFRGAILFFSSHAEERHLGLCHRALAGREILNTLLQGVMGRGRKLGVFLGAVAVTVR